MLYRLVFVFLSKVHLWMLTHPYPRTSLHPDKPVCQQVHPHSPYNTLPRPPHCSSWKHWTSLWAAVVRQELHHLISRERSSQVDRHLSNEKQCLMVLWNILVVRDLHNSILQGASLMWSNLICIDGDNKLPIEEEQWRERNKILGRCWKIPTFFFWHQHHQTKLTNQSASTRACKQEYSFGMAFKCLSIFCFTFAEGTKQCSGHLLDHLKGPINLIYFSAFWPRSEICLMCGMSGGL